MCKCLKFISNILDSNIFGMNTIENESKECVICLEKENQSNKLIHIDKYIYNRACTCNYYIHENCFISWRTSHYYRGINNEMNCLICNSIGKLYAPQYKVNNIGFFEMVWLFLCYTR